MKKITFNAKTIFLISPLLFLMNSPALSHTTKSSEFGISHAFLSPEHIIPLVFVGILVGIFMMTRKRSLIVAGNLGLIGFLAFLFLSHSLKYNFLFGLEFLRRSFLIIKKVEGAEKNLFIYSIFYLSIVFAGVCIDKII